MDGRVQEAYPFKNWSSLMLWNCAHPDNAALVPALVNTMPGRWLHGFGWIPDKDMIGSLPGEWNWLEGSDTWDELFPPAGIHYTRGGPWMADWQNVEFADVWNDANTRVRRAA